MLSLSPAPPPAPPPGVSPAEVVTAVREDDAHNQLSIAYHLILDNRSMKQKPPEDSAQQMVELASSPPSSAFTMKDIDGLLHRQPSTT